MAVGPEDPLARGLVDLLLENGFNCFGPKRAAAEIECDKAFAKNLMHRHQLPTAKYRVFSDVDQALQFLDNPDFEDALVVKATGLALGKGVVVADNLGQARDAVRGMLERRELGNAGSEVVVEQLLHGHEFSVLAFSDGQTVRLLPTAQDHKRAYFKDQGPNTGGMGAISPFPLLTEQQLEQVKQDIMQRTVDAMRSEGRPFVGVLFAGLMLTPAQGPQLLEFNCRFGDPETQTVLPLLKSDLYEVMLSCAQGHHGQEVGLSTPTAFGSRVRPLAELQLISSSECAVSVVVASGGYPRTSTKHQRIRGLDRALAHAPPSGRPFQLAVYHAATYVHEGHIYTNGGRVLSLVGRGGDDLPALAAHVQEAIKHIEIDHFFYRTDIGERTFRTMSHPV